MNPTQASNPFVGLRPFEKGDAHLFFGRDQQVDHLLECLRAGRFVAVLGSSGSGKSSLIRAGLLPALEGGFITRAGSAWRLAVLRPGASPIRSFALAIAELGSPSRRSSPTHVAMIEATIRRGSLGLVEALREAGVQPGEQVMVVVDQFEELFTFKRVAASIGASDDAALFVKLLLAAVRHPGWPVHVVLTMRAEFLGTCSEFRQLPEAISDGLFLIPRLNRDQLAQAITGPVAVAGARIAPSLVQQLLNDVGDDPDQLPVLQHVLMRMWNHWRVSGDGDQLALQHYEAVGEMANALSLHADEAYGSLTESQPRIAERIFKSLTERTQEGTDLRRPTALGELAGVAQTSVDEARGVIDVFRAEGRSFLMPPAAVPLVADSVIDISHESLIRQWKRLNDWAGEEFADGAQFRRVDEAAAGHAAHTESLWRGPALAAALGWRDRFKPTEIWARRYGGRLPRAMTFLDQSRRRRRFLWGAIAAGVVAGAMVTLQQIEAHHAIEDERVKSRVIAAEEKAKTEAANAAAKEAKAAGAADRAAALKAEYDRKASELNSQQVLLEREKATEAQKREMENRASALRQSNLLLRADKGVRESAAGGEVAALVSLHVLRRAEQSGIEDARKDAEAALRRHLALLPPLRWKGSIDGAVTRLTLADGRLIVSGDDANDPSDARVWTDKGTMVATPDLRVDPGAGSVAVSADGRTILWTRSGRAERWVVEGGMRPPVQDAFLSDARKLELSSQGRFLLGLSGSGVRLWDFETGQAVDVYRGTASAIAFSHDEGIAAAAVRNGQGSSVVLWDVRAPGRELTRIPIPVAASDSQNTVRSVVFSPGRTFLAATAGSRLHVWRLISSGTDGLRAEPIGPADSYHSRPINDVVFSANEQLLATGGDDGAALIFRLATTPLVRRDADIVRHDGPVNAVAFSPDARTLATASDDGTARTWRGTRWVESARVAHTAPVRALAFLSDDLLASGAGDRIVKVSDLAPAGVGSAGATGSAAADAACARLGRDLKADEWLEFFTTERYEPACPKLSIDPKELLRLQSLHAKDGNAVPAHDASLQFQKLGRFDGVDLDLLLETAEWQAKVGNKSDADALLRYAPKVAAAIKDPFELIEIAGRLRKANAGAEADELLRRVSPLSSTERDPTRLIEIATVLGEAGKKTDAAEILARADKLLGADAAPADVRDLAVAFAAAGRRTEASEAFVRAGKLALAPAAPSARDNNEICWQAAIRDFPNEVLANCEAAVRDADTPRSIANYRDSRGVAYALLGRIDLAIADFEVFVADRGSDPEGKVRAEWVRELKQGRNPFAQNKEKVLAPLRR